MIKFLASRGRVQILGLGISRANVERLIAGDPIRVIGSEMHLQDLEILLFFGEDERELTRMLKEWGAIGPETQVHVDERLKNP